MLVLSRRRNEKIIINDDVVLTVLRITCDKVRIGIEAPRTTPVHRKEVYDRITQAGGNPNTVSNVNPGRRDEFPRSVLVKSVRRTS
jgi:carbon storage regulator